VRLADAVIVHRVRRAALKHLHLIFPRHLKAKFDVRWIQRVTRDTPGHQLLLFTVVNVNARWKKTDAASESVMADIFEKAMKGDGWENAGGGCGHEKGVSYFNWPVNARAIPVETTWWVHATSAVWASLSTSFLIDYYAPLLIGCAPLFVAGVKFVTSLAR
jgi:hypothetical protein